MKRIIVLIASIILCCSCVNDNYAYYNAYYQTTEKLLDYLYEMDAEHDICWQDTIMESYEYEQYETIRDRIENLNNR